MVLKHLKLRRAVKVGVYCTFLLGIINIAFTLARFLTLFNVANPPSFTIVGQSPRPTFPLPWLTITSFRALERIGLQHQCINRLPTFSKALFPLQHLKNVYFAYIRRTSWLQWNEQRNQRQQPWCTTDGWLCPPSPDQLPRSRTHIFRK